MLFKSKFTQKQYLIQQVCCQSMYTAMLEKSKTCELTDIEKEVIIELEKILNKFNKIIK
jgi:hypothetical protein